MPACVERGVESELVVYPREGHGLREDAHRRDFWRRAVAWFDRYLRPDRQPSRLMQAAAVLRFILRRLAIAIPLLLIVSFGVFALVHLAPGDPVRALLGSRASDPATLAAIRERYHLNDPFIVQYGKWLWQVLQGDLGRSIQGSQLVTSAIRQRLGLTIFLGLMSSFLVLFFGILLGMLAGFRRGSRLDRGVVMFGVFGISSPAFVTGILLLYLFGVVIGWFPIFGAGRGFLDRFWHLTLPAVALALSIMAIVVKITRAAVIQELDKDYVVFARARGLSPLRIVFGYVLRNALIPVVTAAGLIIVGLVANAIYVEVTFALPGLGSLTVEAVQRRDIPLIQGTTLVLRRLRHPAQSADRSRLYPDRSAHPLRAGAVVTLPLELQKQAPAAAGRRRIPVIILLAMLLIAIVVVCALFAGAIAPDSPDTQRLLIGDKPPSAAFLAGTDLLGRDVLSRVIHGAWTALAGPIVIAVGAFSIATLLGLLSGYLGGLVDSAIMRWVDFMFALPGPLVAIVVVGVVGGGYWVAVLVLVILFTAPDTRIVRSAVLEQRPRPYIDAARSLGVSKTRILFIHILPNVLPIVLAYVLLDFAFALVNLAGLSFLGLGVQPGTPDWGRMLFENRNILFSNPVALLLPAAMIILTAVSMNLIGDWLAERWAK